MTTPTLIPMIDPQGTVRMIPMDQVESAKKAGGKVARKFQAPDGTKRWIPAEQTDEAVKAGGKPVPLDSEEPPKTTAGSLLDRYNRAVEPYTRIEAPGPDKWNPREALKAVGNIGAGGLGVILHPLKTAEGTLESIGGMITAPAEMLAGKKLSETVPGQMVQSFKENPYGVIEAGIGQAGATAGAGEAIRRVPGAAGNALRSLAGTGSKTTEGLVRDVKASGAASDAYSKLQSKIETARENALTDGNKKYSTVNEALNPIQADPEAVQGALANATEALKGSHSEPTMIRSMMSKFERGDPWTYEDLQGDYSRLGKELSKGTLPGDEFHAYDVLHEALGDEMQRIADSQGLGEQLKGARDYWRRMKQTFGKPYNANDAASGVLQHASPELTQHAAVANRVRLLNSFDPEIQGAYNDVVKANEAAKKTGLPSTTPGESPKINAEDIQVRKKQGAIISKAPHLIRSAGYRLGAFWPAIDAIRDLVQGHIPSVGGMLGGATGIAGGAHVLSGLLENPSVVEFLTKATPADVAQVPPELRGNLQPIIDAANQKGIRVSPAFGAAVGAVSQPRAGDILRQQ